MDNFVVIYKILKALEQSMDFDEFDSNRISPSVLGVSKERRNKLLIEMQREGYIDGLIVEHWLGTSSSCIEEPIKPTITLKGLEYLSENSTMRKAANLVKGIAEIVF